MKGKEWYQADEVAEAYELDGERLKTMPPTTERWADCEPVFRTFDGWDEQDWETIAEDGYDALPAEARTYLEYISNDLDVPIYAIGVGPSRGDTIVREQPY